MSSSGVEALYPLSTASARVLHGEHIGASSSSWRVLSLLRRALLTELLSYHVKVITFFLVARKFSPDIFIAIATANCAAASTTKGATITATRALRCHGVLDCI